MKPAKLLFGLWLALAGSAAQTRAAFEVASIKPHSGGDQSRTIRPSAGRFSASNMTLKGLLKWAYQVGDFQISGGPGWIDSDGYDIEAKSEGNASREQMMPMLQSLLQDRFDVMLHRATEELPIYSLTVAKGGLKLAPVKDGGCTPPSLDPPAPGQTQSNFCGYLGIPRGEPGTGPNTAKPRVLSIATAFSMITGRWVVDKTGIAGAFPVHLKYNPDDFATGAPLEAGPSIFTAIQEQLGLKLESGKGPVEVIVIDRAEKPSEN